MTPEADTSADLAAAPPVDTVAPPEAPAVDTSAPEQATEQAPAKPEEPTDLLSVVTAVLEKNKPAADTPAAEADTPNTTGQSDPNAGTAPGQPPATPAFDANGQLLRDLTDGDFADVEKPSVKRRIDALLSQRAAARAETEALRGGSDLWSRHVEYLQGNNISPEQAQLLYQAGALLGRGDFKGFVDIVRPYVDAADRALGNTLPPDLQQRVDDGLLGQEDATELARARAAALSAEQQTRNANARIQAGNEERAAQQAAAHATSVRSALAQWEAGVLTRDPEWSRKKDAVTRYAMAMRSERGLPASPQEAIAWAEEAYASVNGLIKQNRPAAAATPQRPSSVSPATQAFPAPKTMREAVEQALARGVAA